MVRVRCPRCGHVWEYRGGRPYATCPACRTKISVRKNIVSEGSGAVGGGAWLTVLRASDYDKVALALRECVERVGGKYVESDAGMVIDVPDDRDEEFVRCLGKKGVELVLKE